MKLRLVAGRLKGRVLTIPERNQAFRPTRSRIRESVAGILTPVLQDAVAADICAGSGACGFEMVSRGARHIYFIENDRYRCRRIEEHARAFGIAEQCSIFSGEYSDFIGKCGTSLDIIYFDPPYGMEHASDSIPDLLRLLSAEGILVYEFRRRKGIRRPPSWSDTPRPFDHRSYGGTDIFLFKKS